MPPPAAFYVVGVIVVVLIFRKSIVGLIARINKLPWGIEATTPPQVETTTAISKKEEPPLALEPGANALLVQGETVLREQIEKFAPEKRDAYLVRMVAALRIAYHLERLFQRMYGSQIAALDHLNPQGYVPADSLKPFCEMGKENAPELYEGGYDFIGWIGFLTREDLIVWKDQTVAISLLGRELLKFIPASGYSVRRRG